MAKHEINPFRNILKDINFKKSQLRTQAKAVQADCSHTHKGKKKFQCRKRHLARINER